MKKHLHIGFLVAFLCFAHSIYSQSNRKVYSFDNDTRRQSIETSEGLQISEIDGKDGINGVIVYKEIKNSPSETKDNHYFTLHIEGDWFGMAIGNGDDFYDQAANISGGNTYKTFLSEGYYDIVIMGSVGYNPAFICYDQLFIDSDTELTAKMEDAIHKIELAPVDVNNNPINESNVEGPMPVVLSMHPSILAHFTILAWYPYYTLYVNDMGDRNKISISLAAYETGKNDEYFIAMPVIENGITEDIVLTNNSDEFIHYTQMFNISKELTEDSYHCLSTFIVYYNFEAKQHGWRKSTTWKSDMTYDRDKPYSLHTNLKYNDTPQTGDINLFISPVFSESDRGIVTPGDWDVIMPCPMAINKNDELMIDFFGHLNIGGMDFINPKDLIETLCNNPISKVYNTEEFYNEGYRTPHLYHQAVNCKPSGERFMKNPLLYIGEFGEQKYTHGHDVIVNVTGDGKNIYNERIVKFNQTTLNAGYSQYQIEAINDQVFAYGRKMINHTVIDFDMTKSDVNPPALTMLRVIDDEKISMTVLHPETARLEITAGDISIDNDWFIRYDKKPAIAVSWSVDGETFYELPAEEDASKFHPGYGYFFNVSLASLRNDHPEVELAWITVKIILTDDVGNQQVQILNPLFHYGGPVGIDEILLAQTSNIAYPNPFTGNVNIELNNPVSGEVYLEIYDITGRIIHQQKMNCHQTNTFTWNGSHLKSGIYFYGIYTPEGVEKGKIIKQ